MFIYTFYIKFFLDFLFYWFSDILYFFYIKLMFLRGIAISQILTQTLFSKQVSLQVSKKLFLFSMYVLF